MTESQREHRRTLLDEQHRGVRSIPKRAYLAVDPGLDKLKPWRCCLCWTGNEQRAAEADASRDIETLEVLLSPKSVLGLRDIPLEHEHVQALERCLVGHRTSLPQRM